MTPLNNILDQQTAKKIILGAVNKNRLASTYLFYGPEGTGKWAMAIALAAILNCESPRVNENGEIIDACGKCRSCHQVLKLIFPELLFALPIPPHKNEEEAIKHILAYLEEMRQEPYKIISSDRQLTIPVEMARNIKRKTGIKPLSGTKRIILFHRMEKMLAASADSLLKLIEEPPPETVIILTVVNPESLLPTILSRAQKIRFSPVGEDLLTEYLGKKYEIPEDKARFAAKLSAGSVGRAIEIIGDEELSSLRQLSFLMFKSVFKEDTPSSIAIVNEFINPNNRGEFERILENWQSFLQDLIWIRFGGRQDGLINNDFGPELEKLSLRLDHPAEIEKIVFEIRELLFSLRRNVHIRPALSTLVLKIRKYINHQSA